MIPLVSGRLSGRGPEKKRISRVETGLAHIETRPGNIPNLPGDVQERRQEDDSFQAVGLDNVITSSVWKMSLTGSLPNGCSRRVSAGTCRLFEDSPISLWEEDFSAVKAHLELLRDSGVTDFREYFEQNPSAVPECAKMVKVLDVNQATLDIYEAGSKQELLQGLSGVFVEESLGVFKEGLIGIIEAIRVRNGVRQCQSQGQFETCIPANTRRSGLRNESLQGDSLRSWTSRTESRRKRALRTL